MTPFRQNILLLFLIVGLTVSGCGMGGEWPRLSARIPGNDDRTRPLRPIETPPPAGETAFEDLAVLTEARAAFQDAQTVFIHALDAADMEAEGEERRIILRGADLALTRANMALSPLRGVADRAGDPLNSLEADTRTFVEGADQWILVARNQLEAAFAQ